ncbi:MAG: Acetyltransferase domain [Frankiaceae bacterium]|nr:Acetyltransferase domain [Frankiaceae bacterium]
MTLADRVAAAYAARLRSYGARAPGRFAVEVAGLLVVSLGVDEPWGLQIAALPDEPDPMAVDAAIAWCRERGRQPQVVVREQHRAGLSGLRQVEALPALVASAEVGDDAFEVGPPRDAAEFRAVYGPAFGMRPGLAEALVVDADLTTPDVAHLVARQDGVTVACAQLRDGEGMSYVSGVGVLPDRQRQGIGSSMLAACRSEAARRGCASVWLNASARSQPFYESIGFDLVDTHLALA